MTAASRAILFAVLVSVVGALFSNSLAADESKSSQPARKTRLSEGNRVPIFNAEDQRGELWESRTELPMNCTIVWFYEGDFLRKSIKQAKLFREQVPELHKKGVQVIGVSGDLVKNHCRFSTTYRLNFTLLADPEGSVATMFGVPFEDGGKARLLDEFRWEVLDPRTYKSIFLTRGKTITPWIFVIDRGGTIIYESPISKTKRDVDAVINFLRGRMWR